MAATAIKDDPAVVIQLAVGSSYSSTRGEESAARVVDGALGQSKVESRLSGRAG